MGASTVSSVSLGRQKKLIFKLLVMKQLISFNYLLFYYLGGRLRKERSRWGGLQHTRAQVIDLF
jgi:hypothetical protein